MPHSLYLGSGIVQTRLRDFDQKNGVYTVDSSTSDDQSDTLYRPSLSAIDACMRYSVWEMAISLFTFALFINSAILITAGASLSNTDAASADLFGIHDLLSTTLSPGAGVLFAVALLLSGVSAGIVCTMAGQMVSEGQLNLHMPRWARRLFTRSLSITPSIIIAGCVGADGLSAALEGSQVALSVILPFVSAPLIWFTCREAYMRVRVSDGRVIRDESPRSSRDGPTGDGTAAPTASSGEADGREEIHDEAASVSMKNHWITAACAAVIWGVIVFMNGALIVLAALGIDG
jgi:metal iron transporter